jgi:hypothetical protein
VQECGPGPAQPGVGMWWVGPAVGGFVQSPPCQGWRGGCKEGRALQPWCVCVCVCVCLCVCACKQFLHWTPHGFVGFRSIYQPSRRPSSPPPPLLLFISLCSTVPTVSLSLSLSLSLSPSFPPCMYIYVYRPVTARLILCGGYAVGRCVGRWGQTKLQEGPAAQGLQERQKVMRYSGYAYYTPTPTPTPTHPHTQNTRTHAQR